MNNEKRESPRAEIIFDDGAKPKKINLKVAPGNWSRMEEYVRRYNATRTGQKLNYTDVINIAIGKYLEERDQR